MPLPLLVKPLSLKGKLCQACLGLPGKVHQLTPLHHSSQVGATSLRDQICIQRALSDEQLQGGKANLSCPACGAGMLGACTASRRGDPSGNAAHQQPGLQLVCSHRVEVWEKAGVRFTDARFTSRNGALHCCPVHTPHCGNSAMPLHCNNKQRYQAWHASTPGMPIQPANEQVDSHKPVTLCSSAASWRCGPPPPAQASTET